jgi:transcriptional regulator of acetoin/glycerol metabolism
MQMLTAYAWPGNIRELLNVVEYAFVVCHDELIAPRHLPALAGEKQRATLLRDTRGVDDREKRDELLRVLKETGGNRQDAAGLLGISRVTLWKLLKKHGIAVKKSFQPGA